MATTRGLLSILIGIGLWAGSASATTITFDFDDDGGPLANGQLVDAPNAFGQFFNISSMGANLGAVVFDSGPAGPNMSGTDTDLLVDSTNILILQNPQFPDLSAPGVFQEPNDHAAVGSVVFDFSPADFLVLVQSIDVIDINGTDGLTITLVDSTGKTRAITVPDEFTGDINSGEPGIATIDFAVDFQESPNIPGLFTQVLTEAGFDPGDIASLSVQFGGSGAVDNLAYVPEPSTMLLLAVGAAALFRRTTAARFV
ncbi:MAG: PEP-CTERM sorting domain-containing protein [Phycisphaerae bacterium]